jgi:tetratricopeptide (TPR) repeat protein
MIGSSRKRSLWITALVVPLLLVSTAGLQRRIDASRQSETAERDDLVLRSPSLVKKLSLGYDALLADIYWTRAVQYYGQRIGDPHTKFESLGPLLDIATTLDPKLVVAYRFGAIFLSEPRAIGAGRTDLAVNLVQRGIQANPDQWLLYYDLGFLYYWRLKDYPRAAETYAEGGKKPHAPLIMTLMAARVAQKGNDLDTSRMIFLQLYESSKDKNVRKTAMRELRALKAQEDEMHLDEIIQDYRKKFGHYPASTKDMVAAGMLPFQPVDSIGFPYVIGPDGRSHLNPDSPVEPDPDAPLKIPQQKP